MALVSTVKSSAGKFVEVVRQIELLELRAILGFQCRPALLT